METVHYGRQVGNSASMKSGDTSSERSNERHFEGVAQDGRNVTRQFRDEPPHPDSLEPWYRPWGLAKFYQQLCSS